MPHILNQLNDVVSRSDATEPIDNLRTRPPSSDGVSMRVSALSHPDTNPVDQDVNQKVDDDLSSSSMDVMRQRTRELTLRQRKYQHESTKALSMHERTLEAYMTKLEQFLRNHGSGSPSGESLTAVWKAEVALPEQSLLSPSKLVTERIAALERKLHREIENYLEQLELRHGEHKN